MGQPVSHLHFLHRVARRPAPEERWRRGGSPNWNSAAGNDAIVVLDDADARRRLRPSRVLLMIRRLMVPELAALAHPASGRPPL